MKVIIVGGVAGGATTATRLRRLDENSKIIIIERGEYISFANCGLPYYIGNVIKEKKNLLLQTPTSFKERFNIDVRIKEEAIQIDTQNKKIKIKKLETNEIYEENYDKLVLSPGAQPINPFKNIVTDKISTLRTINDAVKIKKYILNKKPRHVVIIGGGYIGVEIAENIKKYQYTDVSIIQKGEHLIGSLDNDMACFIHNTLRKKGVQVILNNRVEGITEEGEKLSVKLESRIMQTDYIILCIGVSPETDLAKKANLKLNKQGGIIVNKYMQTSDENIYALGDAIEIENYVTKKPGYIPLAGPANKQARVVANNIVGRESTYNGTIGSSILKIFDNSLVTVGINEEICKNLNIDYKKMIISPYSHATYYPCATQLTIKAIYENKTGKILGAQVFGKESVDKIGDILATAIKMNMTARDLSELELCYAPPFSSAKSPINILGNAIENELDGLVEGIYIEELEKLKEPYILDVRTDREYETSHIENVIHIPLDNLRENLEKLDKSKEIIVHCHTGLRSYIACRILNEKGFKTRNLIGGYYLYNQINKSKIER